MSTGAWLGLLLAVAAVAFLIGIALGIVLGGADARARARARAHAGSHDDVTELAKLRAKVERVGARESKSP